MKNRARLLLFILIASAALSCRRDDTIPHCELHQDDCYNIDYLKTYLHFELGSYWVYEEQTSGLLDSVYVIQSYDELGSFYFSTTVFSEFENIEYEYWPVLGTSCPDTGLVQNGRRCTFVKMYKGIPGNYISETFVLFYWAEEGDFAYNYSASCENNVATIKGIMPSFTLIDSLYKDVLIVEEGCNESENGQHTTHYYAKNRGLIKKELVDSNETWNLIRFNLIQ